MSEETAIAAYVRGGGAIDKAGLRSFLFKGDLNPLRSGVIVEVTSIEQAKIAEESGASCVLLTDPNREGIIRMPDPLMFTEMRKSVSIPIIVKVRVGHFVEAQILESVGVKFINECHELSAVDAENCINKHKFKESKFICKGLTLGEALRRVEEGARMVKTHADLTYSSSTSSSSSSGNIKDTLSNLRTVMADIRFLCNLKDDEVFAFSKKIVAPYDLVKITKKIGRLPAVHFAAGGIATPADAALLMQLGCDGVFLGSEIFQSANPRDRLRRMILAAKNYNDPVVLARVSSGFPQQ